MRAARRARPAGRRVIVIGASVAGVAAATGIRAAGFGDEIVLIGDEPHAPYDRPPLSKQLLRGTSEVADIGLAGARGLASASVVQRLACKATSLDVERQVIEIDGCEEIPYDGVVIATGSIARHLPGLAPGRGVHQLRTLDDAVALRADLLSARSLVVVGAGFVGLEVACSARAMGLSVTVVENAAAPLARVLGADIGKRFADLHHDHGVDVRCGVSVVRASVSDGRVASVELDDGTTIPADVVVVGVGADPATDWLSNSGLEVSDGLVCDASLRAAPRVFAAGDVARWEHPLFGSIRVEHWMTAIEHARAAAQNLVAELDGDTTGAAPVAHIPYFWSDQYGVKIQMAGWAHGYDEAVDLDLPGSASGVLLGRAGRLVGALGWAAPVFVARQRQAIARCASLADAVSEARHSGAEQVRVEEGATT